MGRWRGCSKQKEKKEVHREGSSSSKKVGYIVLSCLLQRNTEKYTEICHRRDENNKILIINTEKDEKIRSHQVSTVPFPFTSVSDYEVDHWEN